MEPTTSTPTTSPDRVRAGWDQHHERLWRSVLAWSGDPEVASDAVAEAFAQVLRRGDEVEDVGRWVWRAAFRIAAGLLGDRRRTGVLHEGDEPSTAGPDDLAVLLDALARLRPEDRKVVVLSLVGGWSSGDVGAITGTSAGAVRVRLHRAKQQLRDLLEDHHD